MLPFRCGVVLAVAASLTGCWVGLDQGRRIEADIARLKTDSADGRKAREQDLARAQRETDQLRREHDAVEARVRKLGEVVDGLGKSSRKTGADMGIQLDKLEDEVARLKVLLDEAQQGVRTSADELARTRSEMAALEKRVESLDGKAPAPAGDGRVPAASSASKEETWKAAKAKLEAGETEEARALLVDFLKRWRSDPLAPGAQYLLGETYFAEKRWREAIFEYRKVSDGAPKSERAPEALVRIGSAFVELSLAKEARLFFEEVLKTYPKSPAARTARARLAALDKNAPDKSPRDRNDKKK